VHIAEVVATERDEPVLGTVNPLADLQGLLVEALGLLETAFLGEDASQPVQGRGGILALASICPFILETAVGGS